MLTTDEYNVAKQQERKLHYLFYLLNYNFQKVDELSGVVLTDNWSINATSDIRRTGSITLIPDDETAYKVQAGSKIWLDKYVQVYIGIEDIHNDNNIVYTNMGIYMINNPSRVYDGVSNTMTLSLLDLMAKMTGLRYGNLEGYEYQIPADSDIKQAIIAVLEECGFTKYVIDIKDEDYKTTVNDISVNNNSTYYNILKQLNEVNIDYQMYFDVDGVFHYEKIPDGHNEQIMVDDDIWKYCYLSHQISTDYESLKNKIIVIGKTHTIKNFGGTATITDENVYNIELSGMKKLKKNLKVGFVAPTKVTEPKLKVAMHDTIDEDYTTVYSEEIPILQRDGVTPAILADEENMYYVVKFKMSLNSFELYDIDTYEEPYTGDLLATISNGKYYIQRDDITVEDIDDLENGIKVTFVTPETGNSDITNPKLVINDLTDVEIDSVTSLLDNTKYVVRFSKKNSEQDYFEFLGEVTPRAEVQEENEQSPFWIGGTIGTIQIVLEGGEYDNISSNDLALQRAEWELYTRCKILDSITITNLPLYWADVNWLINITFPNESEPIPYIIQSISTNGGVVGTQNITASRYYPLYNNV